MKKYLVLLALFVPLLVFGTNTAQVTDVSNSSMITRESFYLYAGSQYKFRTYSTDDTVVHILNSSNVQVAYNDDCGTDCDAQQSAWCSTVTYTPAASGYYYGIIRHYSNGQVGKRATVKAFRDGSLIGTLNNRPVGGSRINIDTWSASLQNRLQFHYLNRWKEEAGGAIEEDTVVYLMSGSNITHFNEDSGAARSARINLTTGSCTGNCRILGGANPWHPNNEGNARAVVEYLNMPNYPLSNWISNDSDQDGVSNQLESIIGSSSNSSNTDEDGLKDYSEIFGYGGVSLPFEGSNPNIKDVFVEVDYFGRWLVGGDPNSLRQFYINHAAGVKERKIAAFAHDNIRVHIDLDDYLGLMGEGHAKIYAHCNTGADPQAYYMASNRSTDFTSARNGIYFWAVAANKHSSPLSWSGGISCTSPGDNFIMSFGDRENGGSLNQWTAAHIHELGHAYGLGHNGNTNGDGLNSDNSDIHQSIMNYKYCWGSVPRNFNGLWNPVTGTWTIPPDSEWRYSTDSSFWNSDLNWNYQDIAITNSGIPTGANGCLPNSMNPADSPKLQCQQPGAERTCDCTFNEWNVLDHTGGTNMILGILTNKGLLSSEDMVSTPIFGLGGRIIAENLDDLMNSGEKYGSFKEKESQKHIERLDEINKKFYTEEVKQAILEAKIDIMKKNGLQEGKDYDVVNGDIVKKGDIL
ncbi:MAG TPA: hypothetical protein P5044_03900 [bacterium]|nr:hypothetical protein [bacterium]